ncbi:hypothetical protein TSAR_009100 [Trichomalopsis sarcophagae]|uniref:Uncharacterized protein n=1 Tax=Trichomalopsis sarcophagae TaxID=543379 RepID=A0A232FGI1_9HYME|nr:hypothetical protein TSAR_009100 [Trichomalopsis sarcophagae]
MDPNPTLCFIKPAEICSGAIWQCFHWRVANIKEEKITFFENQRIEDDGFLMILIKFVLKQQVYSMNSVKVSILSRQIKSTKVSIRSKIASINYIARKCHICQASFLFQSVCLQVKRLFKAATSSMPETKSSSSRDYVHYPLNFSALLKDSNVPEKQTVRQTASVYLRQVQFRRDVDIKPVPLGHSPFKLLLLGEDDIARVTERNRRCCYLRVFFKENERSKEIDGERSKDSYETSSTPNHRIFSSRNGLSNQRGRPVYYSKNSPKLTDRSIALAQSPSPAIFTGSAAQQSMPIG